MTELVLYEGPTGFYLFKNKEIVSSLELNCKSILEIHLSLGLNQLPPIMNEFLTPFRDSVFIVDKCLNKLFKENGFKYKNDLSKIRESKFFFAKQGRKKAKLAEKNKTNLDPETTRVIEKRTICSLGHMFSREKLSVDIGKEDNLIVQAIEMIVVEEKDITKHYNRFIETYSHHFPELKSILNGKDYVLCSAILLNIKKNFKKNLIF
ncbi:hypothetical protein EDEG_00363 [Edhazardia aedis USNM 41457]|uniref:NOSIC domain-containing protein n=1 Tax=Edhazardia aedis (strain USNM 41457) TaxID=1003232 RepID=J9DK77_EDHAE|nr:hypothetical protein EDEG_00363 [Edhazardia aedis USNM 41457]|eukprot:EJW01772.1 hypothetical protein EDEG_00363 [Edhazardia aedis USNM 41457]